MKFEMKKLAAACTLAFASTAAFADGPCVTAPTPCVSGAFEAPELTVYLSGASAPQAFLGSMMELMFQGAKGTDWFEYYDNQGTPTTYNTSDGANYRAYYGRLKTTAQDANMPSSIANKRVLFVNRAQGGSVWGVNPVARNQALAYMPITDGVSPATGNCSPNPSTFVGANYLCGVAGVDPSDPSHPVGGEVIPDFGVSDVEPKMFKDDRNVEFGQTQLSDGDLGNITNFGVSGLMFGAAATKNVFDAGYTSIPRSTFGGMLSGTITTWDKASSVFSSTDHVMVCRRVNGSGTQASYNQYFNNFPCGVGALGGAGAVDTKTKFDSAGYGSGSLGLGDGSSTANAIGIDASTGYTVIENSSSGNVRTCLTAAQAGNDFYLRGDDNLVYLVHFGGGTLVGGRPVDQPLYTGGAARKAIGNLSLDSKGGSGFSSSWVYLDLNGVAPTQANMIDLSYDFVYELSMQYRTAGPNKLEDDLTGGLPLKKTFADEFIKRAGSPTVLALITNVNTKDAVAALPLPGSGNTPGVGKTMKGTRFGNSCQPIQPQ